jgi:hypothetical protein
LSDHVNPWVDVPTEAPHVLASDWELIRKYNERHSDDRYRLQLNVLPEPFIGRKTAPIVLLNLNPGFDDRDPEDHQDKEFQVLLRSNYEHGDSEYPFYSLDPRFENGGRSWWEKKLKPVLSISGREQVARSVLCVEFFPYHSRRFGNGSFRVPSQEYGFQLVRLAIQRGAAIIIMRGRRLWLKEIPELERHSPIFALNSPQNVVVSTRNCKGFREVVSLICGGTVDA